MNIKYGVSKIVEDGFSESSCFVLLTFLTMAMVQWREHKLSCQGDIDLALLLCVYVMGPQFHL